MVIIRFVMLILSMLESIFHSCLTSRYDRDVQRVTLDKKVKEWEEVSLSLEEVEREFD
jgi:hypothetical protein